MEDIKLLSGNTVRIGLPDIKQSLKLVNAVGKAFSNRGLDIKIDRNTDLSFGELFKKHPDALTKGLSDMVFDESIADIIMECAEKCLYVANGKTQKVTYETFNDIEARKDYFDVLFRIALANIKPFFAVLLTALNQTTEAVRSE